jgi:hypothetical protein
MFNVGLRIAGITRHRAAAPTNSYAASAGNVLSLSISVGQVVVIFTNSNAAPSSVTDDGGNIYTRLQDGSFAFNCDSYSAVATNPATTVTANGGGTFFCNIAGASIGGGATASGASAINAGAESVSLTTTKNNSLVLGVVQGVNSSSGGFTVTNGIQKAISVLTPTPVDGRNNQVILLSSVVVPSSGTVTTLSCGPPNQFSFYNALSIEVKF